MKNLNYISTKYWDTTGDWRLTYYKELHSRSYNSLSIIEKYECDLDTLETSVLESLISKKRFGNILDIGCGVGRSLIKYIPLYPEKHFMGIDISPYQISLFEKQIDKIHASNAQALLCDASKITSIQKKFDLILFCNNTLGCLYGDERSTCLKGLPYLLNKNGIIFISNFEKFEIAEQCYSEWNNKIISIDKKNELITLEFYKSYWKSKESLLKELSKYHFLCTDSKSAGLGSVYLFKME